MIIQHQTVNLITNRYNFPFSIRNELEHCIFYSDKNRPKSLNRKSARPYVKTMEFGTENMDCIIVGLKLKKAGFNPVILNLANQEAPAAAKFGSSEGGTQEENLFKRSTLYLSLWPYRNPNFVHKPAYQYDAIWSKDKQNNDNKENDDEHKESKKDKKKKKKPIDGYYPMHNKYGGIYSKNVYIFRGSEKSGYCMLPLDRRCVVSFIAVAAQIHYNRNSPLNNKEKDAFRHKIRAIFRIAYENGHDSIVLGALGCGIFGNPPEDVAKIFKEILMDDFNGCFARIVFAILWDHNSKPQLVENFTNQFPENEKLFCPLDTTQQ